MPYMVCPSSLPTLALFPSKISAMTLTLLTRSYIPGYLHSELFGVRSTENYRLRLKDILEMRRMFGNL